jgi:hypothetical protein
LLGKLWRKKQNRALQPGGKSFLIEAQLLLSLETIQAINRSAFNRLKGYFSFNSAFSANSLEHFPRTSVAAAGAPILAAVFAAFGFIFKPFFMIKLLFSCGKYELLSTVLAH